MPQIHAKAETTIYRTFNNGLFEFRMRKIDKYKIPVSKEVHIFLAGFIWMSIGIMLLIFSFIWLWGQTLLTVFVFSGLSIVISLLVYKFGFIKIEKKNLKRIMAFEGKKCVFAFLSWKSYLIIPIMITMGSTLRHSSIPKEYLAIMYLAMGLALLFSGVDYLIFYMKEFKK